MPLEEMIKYILAVYHNAEKWQWRVSRMSEAQIYAVFKSMCNRGLIDTRKSGRG